MSLMRKKNKQQSRRAQRVRARLSSTRGLLRISVQRSLKNFHAQLIDDVAGKTVLSSSTLQFESLAGDKRAQAQAVGVEFAKKAIANGITQAYLDRGSCLYHGRVASFADGLREGGLQI